MAKLNDSQRFEKLTNGLSTFVNCTIVFLFLFSFISFFYPDERDVWKTKCRPFVTDWYQVDASGTKTLVDVPGKVPAEKGEWTTLVAKLPDKIEPGEELCFRVIWQDVCIYIDGELRLEYNTANSRPFGTNSPTRHLFLQLEPSDAGKEMTYTFLSYSKYAGDMRPSYIGDRLSIWLYFINVSGLRTGIAAFLMTMSILCILVCAILKLVYKKALPLHYLALVVFLCSFWMLSEVEARQLAIRNISILSYYTYWCLMLISLPLLMYTNEIQNGRYRKVYLVPMMYSLVITIIGTLLQCFDIVQFVDQVPFMHIGIIISIVCIITTITMDAFRHQLGDYIAVGIGVYGMLFTAVIEMLLYYFGSSLTLGTVLGIGLLFLLVMAIIKTGQDLLHSEQEKQQSIIAREAQARFLANMSHEIRTPINAIIGMNEMILRENEDPTIKDYAHNIHSASKMLLGLVNDVLDFSQIESGQLALTENEYHTAAVFQDEMQLLKARTSGKPISIQLDLDTNIPRKCLGDELRLKQIITNLLSNAAKYTERGRITLTTTYKPRKDNMIDLCVSVSDTGIGIKSEDIDSLFDSFKRLDLNKNRTIQGTGLGLNIVNDLVSLMGGYITVDSKYGKGSTFTITIPQKVVDKTPIGDIDDALNNWKKDQDIPQYRFTAPKANILVVDDNEMNLTLLRQLLKRTKMQVDTASSGKKCLELTKEKKYNIIFMDHMMPEMDGIETLHALRAENGNPNQDAYVVALTANAIVGCREMYLDYGFNDYFSKPVQANKLDTFLMQRLPKALVHIEGLDNTYEKTPSKVSKIDETKYTEVPTMDETNNLLLINKSTGLEFCAEDEELYQEMLQDFASQATGYLDTLPKYVADKDWKNYRIIVHGLKSSSLYVGATNFSQLCLKHENAAKNEEEAFITSEYNVFIETLQKLIDIIKQML